MKHILIPIDSLEDSENIVRNAAVMAEKLGIGVMLYHALPLPIGFAVGAPVGGIYEILKVSKARVSKELHDLFDTVSHGGVPCEVKVSYGSIGQGLEQIENSEEIAMVMITSDNSDGLVDRLTGNTVYDLANEANCPVIVIPQGADIKKMKSIALAGDYAEVTAPALFEELININKAFFGHIEVIHIHEEPLLQDDEIAIARGLKRYFSEVPHTFHFKQYNDVKEGLLAFCLENEVDLLAMIPRQHSLLERLTTGSQTKKMVQELPMPVMVLQD